MHKYVVKDVWMSLMLSINNFIGITILLYILYFILSNIFNINFSIEYFISFLDIENHIMEKIIKYNKYHFYFISGFIVLVQSIFIYSANCKYTIDMSNGMITFPRSDIENNIFEIILLVPYWNLLRTKTVHANEIENLYLDTKRWSTQHRVSNGTTAKGKTKYKTVTSKKVRYTINIAGKFGSANLQFLSRQKRDEVRNAIQQCVKEYSGNNIDRKVSEFN